MTTKPKLALACFNPGRVMVTPGVIEKTDPDYAFACLSMHLAGNWGLVDSKDWDANDKALNTDGPLLSVYALPDDPDNFWIITEADRSVTTLLLPEDY